MKTEKTLFQKSLAYHFADEQYSIRTFFTLDQRINYRSFIQKSNYYISLEAFANN